MNAKKIKVIRSRIPRYCICPICRIKQRFKKKTSYWKTVKDMHVDKELILKVRVIYAKCLNPNCPKDSFMLPTPNIDKYQRATNRVIEESIASLVDDLSTTRRVSKRLNRAFNTTGSKSTVDRWKHRQADKFDPKDIIAEIGFSGILCIDEFKSKGIDKYSLISTDALRNKILYIDPVPLSPSKAGSMPRRSLESCLWRLKDLGIDPWAVIVDLLFTYPKQIKKVWPEVIIQYDHFHVMQVIYRYFNNAIIRFRQSLKGEHLQDYKREIWEKRWFFLSNMDNWDSLSHQQMEELIDIYQGTIIEDILIFKERIRLIFESSSKKEAYELRDDLAKDLWWRKSYHLTKIMDFLLSPRFEYMITYLEYPQIPKCGNSETMIRTWRQMEKVRYGFKTEKGQLDHLKLFQVNCYLNREIS